MKQRGYVSLIELLIIATVIGVLAAILALPRAGCKNTATAMGLEWRWGWTTDCMVKHKGRWIPLKNLRVVDD